MPTVNYVAAWQYRRQTRCSDQLGRRAVKVNARHGQLVQDDRKAVHLDVHHALAAVAAVAHRQQTEALAAVAAAVEAEVPARVILFVLGRALGIPGRAAEGNIFFSFKMFGNCSNIGILNEHTL